MPESRPPRSRPSRPRSSRCAPRSEVEKTIVGQDRVVECALTALFAGGHVLLEGLPGLGKTELVKALARALQLQFRRIQFTPDLMPTDVLGTSVLNTDDGGRYRLEFQAGPVFTQLLLADEINRATPKTQSALLECMQEGTVTVAGVTRPLAPPFMVLATQNPIEQEGTYPLPEAQLDRFLLKVDVPFLDRANLNAMLARTEEGQPPPPAAVLDGEGIRAARALLREVVVAPPMRDYAARLVLATHPGGPSAQEAVQRYVRYGASPRAAQALLRAGRVRALTAGRGHVAFADVRHFAREVLQHRVLLNYDGQAEGVATSALVEAVVGAVGEDAQV
jgi:MoxR-like ATPase